MTNIFVYYEGDMVAVTESTAKMQNLRHGQNVTTEQFWEIIRQNAETGILAATAQIVLDKNVKTN